MVVSNVFFFQFCDVKMFAILQPKLRKFSQKYTKKTKNSKNFQNFRSKKSEFSSKQIKTTLVVSVNMVGSQQGVKWVKLIKHSQTLQQNHVLCCTGLSTINQQKCTVQSFVWRCLTSSY
jgi:hypothetical protein